MTAKLSDADREHAAQIVALFSVFVHAWLTNDFAEASRVQFALKRAGVKVRILHDLVVRQEVHRA